MEFFELAEDWSEEEKVIYNMHLFSLRKANNKPYTPRKNFDKVDPSKKNACRRILNFFTRNPEINRLEYFEAPYKLYTDSREFSLEYYASMQGIRAWSQYKSTLQFQDPDLCIDETINSLEFIAKFCISKKNHLINYPQILTPSGIPEWVLHLKDGHINLYSLMSYKDLTYSLKYVDDELIKMLLDNVFKMYPTCKTAYLHSKLKTIVDDFFQILSQKVLTKIKENRQ